MRLFKKKKSKGVAIGSTDSGSFPTAATNQKQGVSSKKNIKGASKSKSKGKATKSKKKQQSSSSPTRSSVRELNATIPLSSSDEEDEISSVDLGDIPRSISTTTQSTLGNTNSNSSGSYNLLPPPLPRTPTRDDGRNDDGDSIGSPCENMRKHVMEHSQRRARGGQQQKRETNSINSNNSVNNSGEDVDQGVECALQTPVLLSTKKLTAKLSSSQPSITLLSDYIQALLEVHSPDPSADLPSRALRALFALSEHNTSHDVRVAMVREHDNIGGVVTKGKQGINIIKNNNSDKAGKLVPTLLNFLQRCPRDSSEQYLTLLVLNNLSIPMENKQLVALDCDAARVLGRMLLEDVGCHLLVIIIVNLTFCGVDVRKSLLLEDDREVQLIDCLGYALMLSSITSEQLSTLGPIPLSSPEGTPHSPRKLLSILRSTLATTFPNYIHNNDDNDNISPPLLLTEVDGCPFPETARWCLCALKNLTRPGKKKSLDNSGSPLSPSMDNDGMSELSGDAIAARAIIDAGLLPVILRVICVAKADSTGTGLEVGGSFGDAAACDPFVGRLPDEICNEQGYVTSSPNMINMPTWNSNSAQDAALYTLMHMTSVSSVREELLRRNDRVGGGSLVVEELINIVDCGDGVGIGDKLLDVVTGDGLVGDVDRAAPVSGDVSAGRTDLGWLALQCMKARMSLSFLLSGTNILLAEHEAHSLIELLCHCIENRSKEGPGGYSAATFTLKGVLHSLRCLLVEPGNRSKFASINGARLNALLLKVVAQYALLSEEGDKIEGEYAIDNEAADDAVVSLYYMSSSGFHESAFLPSAFGKKSKSGSGRGGLANRGAKDVLVKVLTLYVGKIHTNSSYLPRHAAIQLMLRSSFLRFEGEVANLTYLGKRYPSRMDFDFDDELLAAADTLMIEKQTEGSRPKQILFSRRQIVRYERYGSNKPKVYANPIIAAEDMLSRMGSKSRATIDDIAIANDIASSAEGSLPNEESHGFIWKWEDGGTVAIDDVQSEVQEERSPTNDFFVDTDYKSTKEDKDSSSTAQKHRGLLSKLGFVAAYEDEPVSIFGFRCSPPKCGRNSVF